VCDTLLIRPTLAIRLREQFLKEHECKKASRAAT